MANTGNPGHPQQQQGGATSQAGVAGTVQDMAQNVAAAAAARAGAVWDQTVHGAQGAGDLVGDVVQVIRRYPIVSIAVGATVGLLLARLLTPAGGRSALGRYGDSRSRYGQDQYPFAK